jgi:AraC family transcriptional regulator
LNETNVLPIGRFYGAGTARQAADAVFTLLVHEQPRAIPQHGHAAPYFGLLESGSYRESDGEHEIVYAPLTLAYHPAGMCHLDEIGQGGARFFMIELGESWAPVVAALDATHQHLTQLDDSEALWLALRLRRTVFSDAFESEAETTIPALLHELVGYAAPKRPLAAQEPGWLAPIELELRERFAERLDIARCAATANVHPAHLARVFRRFRGKTLGAHVAHLRLREACRKLSESDASLSEIAAASGFADQSHLTRALGGEVGEPPGRFRRIFRTTPPGA